MYIYFFFFPPSKITTVDRVYHFAAPFAQLGPMGDSESDPDTSSSECSADRGERLKQDAQEQFAEQLISIYLDNVPLTAQMLCLIAWWAVESGVKGFVEELRYPPGRQSGKYSEHLQSVLHFDSHDERLYTMTVPGFSKYDLHRTCHDIWVLPPHEMIHSEVSQDSSLADRVADAVRGADWCDNYYNHPVVKGAPEGAVVHPLGFYVDGAPFTKNDGYAGMSIYHLVSGYRNLCVLIRKSNMCKCGCRGWCTLYPILYMLHCSFEALACGRFWEGRHDGKDWLETFEDFRASVAGEFMCCIAAICNTKCDWMEYSTTFGFPTWSHNVHPCVLCNAEKHELHVLEDARIDEVFPFDLKSMITYDRDAARCEVWVTILSAVIHAAFRTCLKTDKSKHETRAHGKPALGLRLLDPPAPVLALGLLHGDRLEPHPKMLEYGEFFQV